MTQEKRRSEIDRLLEIDGAEAQGTEWNEALPGPARPGSQQPSAQPASELDELLGEDARQAPTHAASAAPAPSDNPAVAAQFFPGVSDADAATGLSGFGRAFMGPLGPSPEMLQRGMADIREGFIGRTLFGAGIGSWRAAFETRDFLLGEPSQEARSDFRRRIEATAQGIRKNPDDPAPGIAMGLSQFFTGFIGLGKITKPLLAARGVKLDTLGKAFREGAVRAATTGAVAHDPHEERLSNFLLQFPIFDGPVTRFLAANPKDTAAEGRLKAILESLGMDALIAAPFVTGLRIIRAARGAKPSPRLNAEDAPPVAPKAEEGTTPPAVPKAQDVPPGPAKMVAEDIGALSAKLESEAAPVLKPRVRVQAGDDTGQTARLIPEPHTVDDALRHLEARPSIPIEPADAARLRLFPQAEIDGVTRGLLKDTAAFLHFGSRARAIENGFEVGAAPLPWQKLRAPEDLEAFIERVAAATERTIAFRRGGDRDGILSDQTVKSLVRMRTQLWGDDPDIVTGHILNAGRTAKTMVADRIAAEALAVKAMDETYDVALRVSLGSLDRWSGDRGAALTELVGRLSIATELLAANRAFGTAAGRTLRTMRKDASTRLTFEEVKKLRDLPPERLVKTLEATRGDIHSLKFILSRPSLLARTIDAGGWLLVNNLLWGLTTHAVNAVSTAFMMASRPLERIIGAYGLQLRGTLRGAEASAVRTQAVREYRYMAASIIDSTSVAARAFLQGESIIAGVGRSEAMRVTSVRPSLKAIQFAEVKDLSDLAGNAMRAAYYLLGMPTRLLGTVDELTRQIRYRGMVLAEASMEADKLGLKSGSAQYRQYLHQRLLNSFDDAGLGTDARAIHEAKVVNFQEELLSGTIGHSLQAARARHPSLVFVFPFVRTPVNVLRYGVKLTPGLNLLQAQYRQALRGAHGEEAQAHAIGQMALGTLITAYSGLMAHLGMATGSGPTNRDARRNMASVGWKPNSIVTRDRDGKHSYWHVGRFDPVGLPFGIAADIVNFIEHAARGDDSTEGNIEKAITALGLSLWTQVRERSYLQSMVQVVDALADPERRGTGTGSRLVANLVPFSSAFRNYGGEAMQYQREARRFIDNILATVPGFAEGVPLKYNALGEPILIRRGPWSSVNDDVVDEEIIRMGMEFPKGFTIGPATPNTGKGVDLRDVTIEEGAASALKVSSRNAFAALQELSRRPDPRMKPLRDMLADTIKSQTYRMAADGLATTRGTKQWQLSRIVMRYREVAMKRLQQNSPLLRRKLMEADMKARAALEGSTSRRTPGRDAEDDRELLRRLRGQFGIK